MGATATSLMSPWKGETSWHTNTVKLLSGKEGQRQSLLPEASSQEEPSERAFIVQVNAKAKANPSWKKKLLLHDKSLKR
ncbi:hypothetical protein L1887_36541 [Cichorium endivia]|nr:hypothetical protein L1887_36541 [Cichorium endivia]